MLDNVRVLITGCCGFIGSTVAAHLVGKGFTVHGVDDESTGSVNSLFDEMQDKNIRTVPSWFIPRWEQSYELDEVSNFVYFHDDYASPEIISRVLENKYDIVIHLAAHPSVEMSVSQPVSTHENNTQKSSELFYACSRSNTKVVFASSAAVYGSDGLVSEASSLSPKSPYALQKLQCEQIGQLYNSLYGLKFIALRFFNVYGPKQNGESAYSTVLAAWKTCLKNSQPLCIDGDGHQSRDYICIDDIVSAINSAMFSSCDTGIFNIATGNSISNNEILSILRQNHEFKVSYAPERIGDIKHSAASVQKALEVLGFSAKVKLDNGIKKMFSNKDNKDG